MAGTTVCTPCCTTTQVTNIPGPAGNDGTNGTNGQDAFTTVGVGGFTVPGSAGGSVTIPLANANWVSVGQIIVVQGPANFLVTAIPNSTSVTGTWQAYSGDVAAGTVISQGATVSPGGVQNPIPRMISTGVAYNVLTTDDTVQVTADGLTITLPTAVGLNGKRFTIIQTAAFAAGTTIACSGGQTINGSATQSLGAQYRYKTMISNGSNWFIVANN